MRNITTKAQAQVLEGEFAAWKSQRMPRRAPAAVSKKSAIGDTLMNLFLCVLLACMLVGIGYWMGRCDELDNPQSPAYKRGYTDGLGDARAEFAKYNPMLENLIWTESSGNPHAVSKKGARGLTQVMPATAAKPGFGVTPMRDHSVQEQIRFGNEYLTALERNYKSKVLAAAAYNAGTGVVDTALKKAKGDVHKAITYLPAETRKYVVKVADYEAPRQQVAMNYPVSPFSVLDRK